MLDVMSSLFASYGSSVTFEFFSVLLLFPLVLGLFSGLVKLLGNR